MKQQTAYYDLLERLRAVEVDRVRRFLAPGMRVLEIGGGSGYQAMLLASYGCEVSSIDVGTADDRGRFFPVATYDGTSIPFGDASFDVIFSSNVLEHVRQLPQLLEEMKRVLVPGGRMIHILPTPAWRAWSMIGHPLWIAKRVFLGNKSRSLPAPPLADAIARRGWLQLLKRAIVPPAHGEFPSAVSELHYFASTTWRRVFDDAGLAVIEAFPNRLFYSGYTLLPALNIRQRESLSRFLGSACLCFVLERKDK